MNQFGIYVFSGTGNTQKCAKYLLDQLEAHKVRAALYPVEHGAEAAQAQNFILCYPVHGFNAPANMIAFCKRLPPGRGLVYFLKTSGEPLQLNSNSSAELMKILRQKGYCIQGEFHCVMPYNIIFRHSDEMASKMWKTAKERIPAMAQAIAASAYIPIRPTPSAKLLSALCRIEHWWFRVNGRFFRIDQEKCTKCMQCVRSCPTKNIHYNDGAWSFGNRCLCCTRCSFCCPQDAFHIGLLNFWRVNGPYDFQRDPEQAEIGTYCRKAYQRYFAETDTLSK